MYNAKSGRRVLDIFSKYCPCGAVSGHEFECILHNEMKASLSTSPTYDTTRYLLSYGYDNIQHIKHVKTTESGASKKRRLVEVRTMRIVLKFLNPKFAKLQLDYKFNPKFMSDKFPLNEVSPEVIDMSEKVDAENEDRISDIQYLLNEIWFGVKKAVAFVEKNGNLWLADLRGAELINHMSEQSKQQSSYKKKCDKCGETRIYNRFGWCRECGSMLLSVAEQSAKRQRQQQVGVVASTMKEEPKLYQKEGEAQSMNASNTEKYFCEEGSVSYNATYFENNIDEDHLLEPEKDDTMIVQRDVLPILDLNPGIHDNQILIIKQFKELVGVGQPGGCFQTLQCADGGATNVKKIVGDQIDDFWFQVALGHGEMAVTRLCMRVVVASLGDEFIFAHKFKQGTGGPDYLKNCTSNRKSWDFVQLCRIALNRELVNQYLLEKYSGAPDDAPETDALVREVLKWMNDSCHDDAMFENLIQVIQLLAAATLFRKALRDKMGHGNSFALDAAIKFILPLFAMFGFKKYTPLFHWSFVRTNHRVYPEVREMLRATNCVNGQGLEYHIEEDIQRVMRTAKTKNAYGLQMAAMNIKYKHDRKTRAKKASAPSHTSLAFFSEPLHLLTGSRIWWRY